MPTASPAPLTADQIDHLRAELAADRRPMVWFTPAAVGVDAGRSAKVVALGDPPEGDFIQVRPTGSQDELSFSPNELTMDKPPRRRKGSEPEKLALTPVPPSAPPPPPPRHDELLVVRERPARKKRAETTETAKAAQTKAIADPPAKAAAEPRTMRPTRGRTKPPAPLTVTLSSTAEGEWTVEVQAGSRRTVRPQPVAAGAVAAAARVLGGDIETAIEGALAAARDQQRAKVDQLEAELAAARAALDELA
jgi:hypothetical protein